MTSLESYRESIHNFHTKSRSDLVKLLPQNLSQTEDGKFDFEGIDLSINSASAALTLFIHENFTGPSIKEIVPQWARKTVDGVTIDGESVSPLANCLSLLLFARSVLESLLSKSEDRIENDVIHWYLWRYAQISQQLIGSDRCPTLLKIFQTAFDVLKQSEIIKEISTNLLFLMEASQTALEYYQYDVAVACVEKLEKLYGKTFSLSGALGKKTKFQQTDIALLFLNIEKTGEPERGIYDNFVASEGLSDILLEDEEILNITKFKDEEIHKQKEAMTPIGNAIVLAKLCLLMKTGPMKSRINEEEQLAILDFILTNTKLADTGTIFEVLRFRSKLEVYKFVKVERGMKQLQALVDFYDNENKSMTRLFYASRITCRWEMRKQLCNAYVKLGLTQAALDEFIALEMLEEACYCLIASQMNKQAEEKADECLAREDFSDIRKAAFWCIKGDIHDNEEFYNKAWELSKHRNARSMRSLGALLVHKKRYEEAADAFQLALGLNHLQPGTWFAHGCASLICSRYTDAAKSFRRCVVLEHDNYEAWANLSNSELKAGNKQAAHRCLEQAIKCNYQKWELWENFLTVSTDLGDFNGAIRAYSQLIDIHPKKDFKDWQVLAILTRAVNENINDYAGKPAFYQCKGLKDLFHKVVTAKPSFTEAWELYATVILIKHDRQVIDLKAISNIATVLQKAVRAIMAEPGWHLEVEKRAALCEIAQQLVDIAQRDLPDATSIVGAPSRLALKSFLVKLRKAKEEVEDKILEETEKIILDFIENIERKLKGQ